MGYISVSDAVEKTGKGQTTIYRLCRKHEHTKYVLREDKKFLIDEDFLCRHYNEISQEEPELHQAPEQPQKPELGLWEALVEHLEDEKKYYRELVERKDEQLQRKDKIITNLQERQRELHHLLHHQTQLLDTRHQEVENNESAPLKDEDAAPAQEARQGYTASARPEKSQQVETQMTAEAGKKAGKPAEKKDPLADQLQIVYAVLAFVMLMLVLAIVYVDEIRSLVEN